MHLRTASWSTLATDGIVRLEANWAPEGLDDVEVTPTARSR
jgi:hypothetical protein